MYYKSESPRVVGEFDAMRLHEQIDEVVSGEPGLSTYEIIKCLRNGHSNPYARMSEVADIRWGKLFLPGAYESVTNDGQVDELFELRGGVQPQQIDDWHADDNIVRTFTLPNVLTTASRFPTQHLIGKISIPPSVDSAYTLGQFLSHDAGKEATDDALEKGNARIKEFQPGEVLLMARGGLHRRHIPEGADGYRFFMRKFPNFTSLHSGTFASRLRRF